MKEKHVALLRLMNSGLLSWRPTGPPTYPVAMRVYRSLELCRPLAAANDGLSTGLAVACALVLSTLSLAIRIHPSRFSTRCEENLLGFNVS